MAFTQRPSQDSNNNSLPTTNLTTSGHQSIWGDHDNSVEAANAARNGQGQNREANRIIVIAEYNDLPLLYRAAEPLSFWKAKRNQGLLLPLIKVVHKFMCIPATSVPSEQLFSKAGELISEHSSRLTPEHVNILLFLNKNA